MNPGQKLSKETDLSLCWEKLDALIRQSQSPPLIIWQKLNPEFLDWNITARNYLSSYRWSDQIVRTEDLNFKKFIYENSLSSCTHFSQSFERELFKQKVILATSILLILVLLGLFLRMRYSRAS